MGFYRKFLASEEDVAVFRARFEIPEGVLVQLHPRDENLPAPTANSLCIRLLWVYEAGIRFPLHPLLRAMCHHLDLAPHQMATNMVRVIMGVDTLNDRTGSRMNVREILHHYTLNRTQAGVWYFKLRKDHPKLVDALPDRGAEDDFIVVSGNWEFAAGEPRDLVVPRKEGNPS